MTKRKRLPFDLGTLEVFLAVCEAKTMAAAATTLGLTQPAVSQCIQELERHLGVALFDRSQRPMALTPSGVVLRQRGDELLHSARQILPTLRRSGRGQVPLVRIGVIDSVTRMVSVPLGDALMKLAAQVIVLSGLQSAHSSALLTRQIDLFVGVDDLAEVDGLERWPVVSEPYVMLLPREGTPAEIDALMRKRPLIRLSARSRTGSEIDRYLRRLGLEPARSIEFDGAFGPTSMVAAGLGWAISTPLCVIEAAMPLQSLRVQPLPGPGLRRRISVVARRRELATVPRTVARVCIEATREHCVRELKGSARWMYDLMAFGTPGVRDPERSES